MSDKIRIGSPCWFRVSKESEWRSGTLMMWSTDHVDYEAGPGQYPVGVVEDMKTREVRSIYVELISFANDPNNPS